MPFTVPADVRQNFQEADPPEWARILAPFISMLAPGPGGAALTMTPQQQPESEAGQLSRYAPLALLIPALMGKARGSQTFGQPLMDQMQQYLRSRTIARTPPTPELPGELGAVSGLRERMMGGGREAVPATPEAGLAAMRERLETGGPQAYVPADLEVREWGGEPGQLGTQRSLPGVAPRTAPREPAFDVFPSQYVVVADPQTNSYAVVERVQHPDPMHMQPEAFPTTFARERPGTGEYIPETPDPGTGYFPKFMREDNPVSRHRTIGEALKAAEYYQTRYGVALDRIDDPNALWHGVAPRRSGQYAPLGEGTTLEDRFPWLREPPLGRQ